MDSQVAITSENYLHNIKASYGSQFNCQMGTYIIFEVPAWSNGYYCDFSTSYLRVRGYVRFERGPERMLSSLDSRCQW